MEIDKNLLIQYMSGMGAGLNPEPWVQNVDEITQQQLGAKSKFNLIDIFKRMLAGDLGEGSKMSADGKGLKLQFDPKSFESMFDTGGDKSGTMGAPRESSPNLLAEGLPGAQVPNVPVPTMPNLPAQQGGALGKLLNPSGSQPGTSVPSLAGLSSKDVSDALSGALGIEGLSQKKMTDVVDMIYKGALTSQARACTVDILKGDPLDQQFPINMPGVGAVTLREWQSLPMDDREYAAYVHTAKKLGDADIMDKGEFVNTFETTEKEKFLRAVMKDSLLKAANLEALATGATRISIGTKLEEKKAFGKLEGQLYFGKGKHIADLNKYMNSKATRMKILTEESSVPVEKVKFIEDAITGRGGTITDVKLAEDGKTMIWTVLWPSGDKETIKHAVRD